MPKNNITVEVAYALPHQQLIIPVQVSIESTAEQAIAVSGILAKFPEIDLSKNQVGIFGKVTRLDTVLKNMDRVEIYRELIADAKEVRKHRAEEAKAGK